ncbi:hypothetical protein GCM10017562_01260 [Streptomyces roseofulvus]|uniref:hypothetical protein n=1 Tax=Streptomyces roseofulvus TaxID=33902 RepID=UPI0031F8A7A6
MIPSSLHPLPAHGPRTGVVEAGEAPGRRLRSYPAAEARTPSRAGFCTGVDFGLRGLRMSDVGRLSLLAEGLTAHVAARVRSESLLVVADHAPGLATVSVIAPGGIVRRPLDPGSLRHVRERDTAGIALYEIGPAAYVRVEVTEL